MRRYWRSSCGLTCRPPNSASRHRSVCGVSSEAQRRAAKERERVEEKDEPPPPRADEAAPPPMRAEAASMPERELLLTERGVVPPLLQLPPANVAPTPSEGDRPRSGWLLSELERGRRSLSYAGSPKGPLGGLVSSSAAKSSSYQEGRLPPLPLLPRDVKAWFDFARRRPGPSKGEDEKDDDWPSCGWCGWCWLCPLEYDKGLDEPDRRHIETPGSGCLDVRVMMIW
jgi:hypothetical protein